MSLGLTNFNYSTDPKHVHQRYCSVHILRKTMSPDAFRKAFKMNPEDLGPCGQIPLTEKESAEQDLENLGNVSMSYADMINDGEHAVGSGVATPAGDMAVITCPAHANFVRDTHSESELNNAALGKDRQNESVDVHRRTIQRNAKIRQRALDAMSKLISERRIKGLGLGEKKRAEEEEANVRNRNIIPHDAPAPMLSEDTSGKSPYESLEDFDID